MSARLGGHEAIELPRISSSDYRPIDRSQLEAGNVYFRLNDVSADTINGWQNDYLEILDNAGLFEDAAGVESIAELVVGENSINPKYAGTPDAHKESSWQIVYSRDVRGPAQQAGTSRCTFAFDQNPADLLWTDYVQKGAGALPGTRVGFQVISANCKSVGFMKNGVASNVVVYPDATSNTSVLRYTVPQDATPGSTIKFQVFGRDLLKRLSFYDVFIEVKTPPQPLPCDRSNGANGNKISFSYCATCDGDKRMPVSGSYCSASQAETELARAVSDAGNTHCSLYPGQCSVCPPSSGNPTGALQAFPFCVACPSTDFAWYIYNPTWPSCQKDQATQEVQLRNIGCTVMDGFAEYYSVCTSCPGEEPIVDYVSACTSSQAIEMVRVSVDSRCTVASCSG